ncbi:MAG: zinc ribbon domain-containing protein [Proteobacteria bacterium]|nr:zinc ribbon domain-containing protein [Pseudomonadota bacterium]NBP13464.1 zinc ribbon domain-containing protein [bacterium]
MPSYSFKCSDCETIFDVQCKMSERTEQHCPSCSSKNYETHHTGGNALIDPVRLGVTKMDGGFREVLSKIANNNYKSNLADKLSRR